MEKKFKRGWNWVKTDTVVEAIGDEERVPISKKRDRRSRKRVKVQVFTKEQTRSRARWDGCRNVGRATLCRK